MDSDASTEAEEDQFKDADDDASGFDTGPARRRDQLHRQRLQARKSGGMPAFLTAKKSSVAGNDDVNGDWKPVHRKKAAGMQTGFLSMYFLK
ncbi:unnamed protein product [Schistocephalus solidus]|uniref:SWR1-complex protein 5 n=1 Tax=Schistocephalus solidus TaxID=70667 RepID=A0A183T9Y9_SCHSO|nr:unnamed protein product [Schistocephalus solidus]